MVYDPLFRLTVAGRRSSDRRANLVYVLAPGQRAHLVVVQPLLLDLVGEGFAFLDVCSRVGLCWNRCSGRAPRGSHQRILSSLVLGLLSATLSLLKLASCRCQ